MAGAAGGGGGDANDGLSPEEFERLYRYANLDYNDVEDNREAKESMEKRLKNDPGYVEQYEGPLPCTDCGGRTSKNKACNPARCPTFRKGWECSNQCHENACQNRRLSKINGYNDILKVGGSKVDDDEMGVYLQEQASSGQLIGEFVGVLKKGDRLLNKHCVPLGEEYNDGTEAMLFLDAHTRGNVARFIQTSCTPNCEFKTLKCGLQYRIGIFATRKIKLREEVYVQKHPQLNLPVKCVCDKTSCPYNIPPPEDGSCDGARPPGPSVPRPRAPPPGLKLKITTGNVGMPNASLKQTNGLGPIVGVDKYPAGKRTVTYPIPPDAIRKDDDDGCNSDSSDTSESSDEDNNKTSF